MTEKANLIRQYLQQQADNTFIDNILDPESVQIHRSPNTGVGGDRSDNTEDKADDDLERFKAVVKYYTKTDNEIKELRSKIKLLNAECNKRKKILATISPTIMQFMSENDIDELNSKDGIIRYTKSYVKSPLTTKSIKDKLYERLASNEELKSRLDKIFDDREKVEKQSLKRIAF
jgi:hypothetical protein